MTVQELRDLLDDFGEETEVRLASQPAWPFEYAVGDVIEFDPGDSYELCLGDRDENTDGWFVFDKGDESGPLQGPFAFESDAEVWLIGKLEREGKAKSVVYIGEAEQLGYLPGLAAQTLGWRQ